MRHVQLLSERKIKRIENPFIAIRVQEEHWHNRTSRDQQPATHRRRPLLRTTLPHVPSTNPLPTTIPNTISPISHDPCRFTQNRKISGTAHSGASPSFISVHNTNISASRHAHPKRIVRGPKFTTASTTAQPAARADALIDSLARYASARTPIIIISTITT